MRQILIIIAFFWCSPVFAAWTAKPLSKAVEDGKLVVFVGYKNAKDEVVTRYHRVDTYDQLLREIRAEIARLDGVDAALEQVELGKVVEASAPSDPPAPPTREQADRDKFFADVVAHRTAEFLKTLPQALQDAYKPEYGEMR